MTDWKEIKPEELRENTFQMIGKDWMLVTAGNTNKANTMTASWGGLGVMWAKNVAYIVIRPQRYTKKFIDQENNFSLSFFDSSFRKTLNYLGTVSGKTEDKITKSGLTLLSENGIPYFAEANTVLFCHKLFAQEINEDSFLDKELIKKWFPDKDYHTLYIAEITKIITK